MEKVQRRLAAIVAADVVGYSRLMGQDEAGTLARLKEVRREIVQPTVSRHGGAVVKTTGDGWLLEFPSAVEAVEFAVAIQRQMSTTAEDDRRLQLRIGINVGDVIVEEDGDIYGDGVNVAARIEALADPGGICISRSVRDQIRDKLPYELEDQGEHQVKNIARPVRVFAVTADHARPAFAAGAPSPSKSLSLPGKPSIAVLPFANMSADPEQEYFADGIAEDIITGLSRLRWLFVIARNSSFTYKGKTVEIKRIGQELGVRYLLEGSTRRAGNRVRVTSQLIDALTGAHLWAEKYDRDLDDIFEVQDEITQKAIAAIEPSLRTAEFERARAKPPSNLDAWENYHRGLGHLFRFDPGDNRTARLFFDRAVELDHRFALAHAGVAWTYVWEPFLFKPFERDVWLPRALESARRSIAIDATEASARVALSAILILQGHREQSLTEADTAIALNPNFSWAFGLRGCALAFSGRAAEAIEPLRNAMRLSPFDPMTWLWLHLTATARYLEREYEAAIEVAQQLCHLRPDLRVGYRSLIAALAQSGRLEEAKIVAANATTILGQEFRKMLSFRVPEWRDEDFEHFNEALRKVGLVE